MNIVIYRLPRQSGRYGIRLEDSETRRTYYPENRHWYISAWSGLDDIEIPTVFIADTDKTDVLRLSTSGQIFRDLTYRLKTLFGA